MKTIIAVAALAVLSACGGSAPEDTTEEPAAAAPAAEVAMAVDGKPLAGSYNSVATDGSKSVWTLADDGTFTLTADGTDPVSGKYVNTANDDGTAKFCADPDGDDAAEVCYAISAPGADGGFTSTDPEGNVFTVARAD